MKPLFFIIISCLFLGVSNKVAPPKKPNILLIVTDDLGYADLGCFGSEIRTPNLDNLAQNGIINTAYCSGATCSPTRAMLLSGVDNHRNGMGTMEGEWDTNQKGKRGYEGYMNFDVAPFPELLQTNGYHTSISGKWHLSASPPTNTTLFPDKRGFTRSFSLLAGGASHFSDKTGLFKGSKPKYVEDGQMVSELPKDFYSTTFFTDKAIGYINLDFG